MTTTCSALLQIPAKASSEPPSSNPGHSRGGSSHSKNRCKYDHCHRLGHTINHYWKLHGRPPCPANVAQTTPPNTPQPIDQPQATPPLMKISSNITNWLSPLHYTFLPSLLSVSIPNSPGEALSHLKWQQAMINEMCALQSSGTWEPVPLPVRKFVVGCQWLYTLKVGPNGKIDRFKARLVAKSYTKMFGQDYTNTFSPVAKMTSIRLLLSIAAICH
ncbi:hypothetical protein CR513_37596, partial [Mucuna pruriens]